MFIFRYLLAVTGVSLLLSGCSAAAPNQLPEPDNASDQSIASAPSQVPDPVNTSDQNSSVSAPSQVPNPGNTPDQNTANVQTAIQLPHIGPAPDIAGSPWLNSDPLTLPALRGQVVLLEFWTFG